MEFVFLGTSSGIPTHARNVSGLVIKRRNTKAWCLVDCGEGTQHQLLKLPYSLVKLDTIFITHVHGDHCYGLPGLLASAAMAGRKDPLNLVGPKGVWDFITSTMTATDMHMSYDINFIDVESLESHRVNSCFNVSACELSHRVRSFAYVFDEIQGEAPLNVEKLEADNIPKGEIWGQLAKSENVTLDDGQTICGDDYKLSPNKTRRVIVGGDNDTPHLLSKSATGCEVLIHEATYTQAVSDKVGPGPQHSSARDIASFAENADVKNLVLTHFSARYHLPEFAKKDVEQKIESENSILCVLNEARGNYSGALFLANDFDHFVLNAQGDIELLNKKR